MDFGILLYPVLSASHSSNMGQSRFTHACASTVCKFCITLFRLLVSVSVVGISYFVSVVDIRYLHELHSFVWTVFSFVEFS